LGQTYQFEILHNQNSEYYMLQVTGTSQLIDAFLQDVGTDRIVEVARSGFTAMEK
jgi:acetolactate synthase small subunit